MILIKIEENKTDEHILKSPIVKVFNCFSNSLFTDLFIWLIIFSFSWLYFFEFVLIGPTSTSTIGCPCLFLKIIFFMCLQCIYKVRPLLLYHQLPCDQRNLLKIYHLHISYRSLIPFSIFSLLIPRKWSRFYTPLIHIKVICFIKASSQIIF